jgi:transcription factor TFIIIB component B''
LSQYGENYELIAYILPGRDRKACKNKFKAEDKKNPARINYCLNNRIPIGKVSLVEGFTLPSLYALQM